MAIRSTSTDYVAQVAGEGVEERATGTVFSNPPEGDWCPGRWHCQGG